MSLLAQLDLPVRKQQSALSDELFVRLRDYIHDTTGIYFQDNKRYLLESRVGRRITALSVNGFGAYVELIMNGRAHTELPELVNAITINETFFYRNEAKFDILEKELIPEIVARQGREVRIWSAACSTGDEPYTVAILVKERLQKRFPQVRFDIVGSDINTDVLDKARAGVYSDYAVRNLSPVLLQRYFTRDGTRHVLSPEIRRMVTFKHVNLADRNAMRFMRGFDVILCANVLIYFDTKAKQEVVTSLYNNLNAGGYLLVGFSETLYGVTQSFQPVRFDKTIAYKKG